MIKRGRSLLIDVRRKLLAGPTRHAPHALRDIIPTRHRPRCSIVAQGLRNREPARESTYEPMKREEQRRPLTSPPARAVHDEVSDAEEETHAMRRRENYGDDRLDLDGAPVRRRLPALSLDTVDSEGTEGSGIGHVLTSAPKLRLLRLGRRIYICTPFSDPWMARGTQGRLAQLVQSASFTPRRSGVRTPQRPQGPDVTPGGYGEDRAGVAQLVRAVES